MSQIFSPYGLRVLKNLGEGYFSGGMHTYPVNAAPASSIFFGDPVGLSGGSIIPLTASPAAGVATGVIGIFQGCSWQDPFRGFVNAQYLPAGIFTSGATQVRVKIADYPWVVMRVQSDGVINPNTAIGLNAVLLGQANGSTFSGNSAVYLSSGLPSPLPPGQPPLTPGAAPGAAGGVRIYGFVNDAGPSPGAGSVPGDAFTDVLVVWNFGVDRYLNATGG